MVDTPKAHSFPALSPRVGSEFRASLLQIPLFGDENMLVQFVNIHPTLAAECVVVGRMWSDQKREITYWDDRVPVAANGGATNRFLVLDRGALLALRLGTGTVGIHATDIWCRVLLQKGFTGGLVFTTTVLQGYLGQFQDLGFPGSPIQRLDEGSGAIRLITWTQVTPTLIRATVPTSRRWRVITGLATAVTSALAGARTVQAQVTASGAFVFGSESSPAQGPGLGVSYTLAPGVAPTVAALQNFNLLTFLGDLELRGGDLLEITINATMAGDALTGVGLLVREWFDP